MISGGKNWKQRISKRSWLAFAWLACLPPQPAGHPAEAATSLTPGASNPNKKPGRAGEAALAAQVAPKKPSLNPKNPKVAEASH
jgi:hypothetical protein